MPRKKAQHKHLNKTNQAKDSLNEENVEIKEDEVFETVFDYDSRGKFSKRPLESNWAKYETPLSDLESNVEDEENKSTGMYDYNFLVENASSDYSHFEFTFEKSWKETKPIVNNSIFKLDLNVLSSGLACIPLYERIGLDEEQITEADKMKCDEEAKRNWEKYQVVKEKFIKNSREGNQLKKNDTEEKNFEYFSLSSDLKKDILDFTFFPEKNLETLELNKESQTLENVTKTKCTQESEGKQRNLEDWLEKALILSDENKIADESQNEEKEERNKKSKISESIEQKNQDGIQPQQQKVIFSDSGENLEDWLDSVLDD